MLRSIVLSAKQVSRRGEAEGHRRGISAHGLRLQLRIKERAIDARGSNGRGEPEEGHDNCTSLSASRLRHRARTGQCLRTASEPRTFAVRAKS